LLIARELQAVVGVFYADASLTTRSCFRAARFGLAPEDLARAAIADLLATPRDDFKAAAERVLRKNEELYRRLA
jgi:hypothetical protein